MNKEAQEQSNKLNQLNQKESKLKKKEKHLEKRVKKLKKKESKLVDKLMKINDKQIKNGIEQIKAAGGMPPADLLIESMRDAGTPVEFNDDIEQMVADQDNLTPEDKQNILHLKLSEAYKQIDELYAEYRKLKEQYDQTRFYTLSLASKLGIHSELVVNTENYSIKPEDINKFIADLAKEANIEQQEKEASKYIYT
jgi:hypothetical protein